ncbi:MAG TPA: hypothetical protein VF789_26740 [Thermoanaerobaculia bacterium]
MFSPQDHLLKSLADETARLLSSGGDSAALLMERLGLLNLPEKSSSSARPGFVGIWKGGPDGYQRAEALRDEWRFWADVQLIPPKGERKRLLLLGESVARGFLYDPDFNPAKALEACVPAVLGQPVEIVDLAKTNLTGPQLTNLISTAPALEPDVLVVFAGNNWLLADKRDRFLEAAALREGGALGLKARREQRLATFVDTLRRQLHELSARLPIVLVVPEINLVDWRFDGKADAPWLPPGRNRRWLECRKAALSALASRRLDEAAALAREMVDLDGGTAASGWTILADCARDTGDLSAARTCLEKARDAHLWDLNYQTPKAVSVIQQALRDCALPGRISVLDLPSCFKLWQGGELPGRRLFLDYCHLSAEGIRVAMAATALKVADLLDAGRARPGIESLVNEIPPPSPEIEATAHFVAALQSSHEGQPTSFVSYLCHEAVRRSPAVAPVMREFLEVRARRAPTWACTAFQRLSAIAAPFLQRYVLLSPKLFEAVLLPAVADTLEKNDLPSLTFLEELRKSERSLTDRPSDLLDPYYRESLRDLDWLEWPPQFRRAYSPTSRYPWVSRSPREVAFTLNCRRTGANNPGECQVRINGTCVTCLPLTHEWSTFRFSAPGNLVRSGVNWLEIDWPLDLPSGEDEIEYVACEHEHGRFVPLLPAFAEISFLTAVQH